MSSDQNPEEIVVDFNFKEIKNNETAEEVKAKPKRAIRKNIVVEQVEDIKPTEDIKPEEPEEPEPVELIKAKAKAKRTIKNK